MINCQLRQADGTVYLEIDDFVIYVKITWVINVTIFMVRPVFKEYRKVCLPSMYFKRPNFKNYFHLKN